MTRSTDYIHIQRNTKDQRTPKIPRESGRFSPSLSLRESGYGWMSVDMKREREDAGKFSLNGSRAQLRIHVLQNAEARVVSEHKSSLGIEKVHTSADRLEVGIVFPPGVPSVEACHARGLGAVQDNARVAILPECRDEGLPVLFTSRKAINQHSTWRARCTQHILEQRHRESRWNHIATRERLSHEDPLSLSLCLSRSISSSCSIIARSELAQQRTRTEVIKAQFSRSKFTLHCLP